MDYTYLNCLAELGVGGAHPGGHPLTKNLLDAEAIREETKVLEVGCGTGRTSAFISKCYGCQITAIDIHEIMVKKAKKRFLEEKLPINLVRGNVEKLPFEASMFDVVLSESVISFTNASLAIPEIKRVLKSEGILLGIEMVLEQKIPEEDLQPMKDFYELSKIRTVEEWDSLLVENGFYDREITTVIPSFDPSDPDNAPEFQLSDNTDVMYFDILKEHEKLTKMYQDVLGYRIFRCKG
ncbi:Methyltransferase domain-containing protein [Oceanobacillus limi]|uniref:Methyltransferase domain-containing protein n=1 Tax=Oceanobacillus limi TaxID=930131 RepID=A0A1I0G9F8_9BACI|nr:class I SAM-dependent methyltransferase [Oceanobacillus limi]SET67578.1 Methyltransferase domain-containing protein [Oceanobacillus limi]